MECLANPPSIPDAFVVVWDWFIDLNEQRQERNKISWSDIKAYFSLIGEKPNRYELELIQALDNQYLAVMTADDAETISSAM